MPTTPNKGLSIPTPGTEPGSWGDDLNSNTFTPLDRMLGGVDVIALASSNVTLSATDIQNLTVKLSGTLTANVTVSSACIGFYCVENNTTGNFTVTWQANFGSGPVGSAIVIPQGIRTWIVSDASAGARLCPTWLPQIFGTLNVNFTSGDGVQFNQTANDSIEHAVYAIFSGNGTGAQWQVNIVNGGANNVAHFKEYIGNTLIRDQTTVSTRLLLPLDFAEVGSVPSAPPSATVRVYGVGSDFLAIQQPSGTVFTVGMPPTVQRFTSGSGTYTPATGTVRTKVRMVGGGGGSSGAGSGPTSGGNGGNTSFGSWTAIGGTGASASGAVGGTGGTGGVNGTGTLIASRIAGQSAGGSGSGFSGSGGSSPLGFGGPTVSGTSSGLTGTGFGSGASGGVSGAATGNGGGAGEYVEFYVSNPAATSYSVGSAGTAGSGTQNGAAGTSGVIVIEEFYN